MAGIAGLEPAMQESKSCALTTWLHPCIYSESCILTIALDIVWLLYSVIAALSRTKIRRTLAKKRCTLPNSPARFHKNSALAYIESGVRLQRVLRTLTKSPAHVHRISGICSPTHAFHAVHLPFILHPALRPFLSEAASASHK